MSSNVYIVNTLFHAKLIIFLMCKMREVNANNTSVVH